MRFKMLPALFVLSAATLLTPRPAISDTSADDDPADMAPRDPCVQEWDNYLYGLAGMREWGSCHTNRCVTQFNQHFIFATESYNRWVNEGCGGDASALPDDPSATADALEP